MTEKQHVVEGSMENKTRFYNMYRSHRKKVVKWRFYTVEPTFQDTVFLQHLHAYIQDLLRYQCLRGINIC